MLTLDIPNMTCGHCVRAITQAVVAADPAAKVQADLAKRQVQVDTTASRDTVVASLTEAGYQPA
jgi:copper chaperone